MQGDTHNCVCEDGWTKDTAGRCTVDINECDQADHPCHQGVLCINTPGAFHCGVCPAGNLADANISLSKTSDLNL